MTQHKAPSWWGPPNNFDDRKNERKISWLELFYDLVYVAAIGQLTHHIAGHPGWGSLGFSFLLFCLVFWSWINGSQYYDLHGSDSIRTRLLTFWQMLAAAAVAITLNDAFEGHHQGFSVAFAMMQVMITYLWWSVGLYDPSHRVFNIYYTVNYSISLVLLVISFFTGPDTAMFLWIGVLLLNLTPSLIGARTITRVLKERGQVFSASAAIVERFGLFTIMVLAESILSTVNGVAEVKDKQPEAWLAFILAILIAFLLWSLYFDMTSEQEAKKSYRHYQYLLLLHFPLLAALSTVGACIRVLLAGINTELSPTLVWMFFASLSVILFSIVGITAIMEEEEEDRSYIRPVSRWLIVLGFFMLLLPFFTCQLGTLAILSISAILLLAPVIVGVRAWVLYKFYDKR